MALPGKRLWVAEAFLSPTSVLYRTVTGPAWATLGGVAVHESRSLLYTAWDDELEGQQNEAGRAAIRQAYDLRRMGDQVVIQPGLPLSMGLTDPTS